MTVSLFAKTSRTKGRITFIILCTGGAGLMLLGPATRYAQPLEQTKFLVDAKLCA